MSDSPTLSRYNYDMFYYAQQWENNSSDNSLSPTPSSQIPEDTQPRTRNRNACQKKINENYRATKNIPKNYGKAITSFSTSELATPYLDPILRREGLTNEQFMDYMKLAKESIQGIDTFRAFLLIDRNDSSLLIAKKRAFQAIGIVFIKYFSVNWIMHGRLSNKIVYLKYRFKILRRIQKPELFTYLQGPKSKKEAKVSKSG